MSETGETPAIFNDPGFSGERGDGTFTVRVVMHLTPKDVTGLRAKHMLDAPLEGDGFETGVDLGAEHAVMLEVVESLQTLDLEAFDANDIKVFCGGSAGSGELRQ